MKMEILARNNFTETEKGQLKKISLVGFAETKNFILHVVSKDR